MSHQRLKAKYTQNQIHARRERVKHFLIGALILAAFIITGLIEGGAL